ncbi:MAG: YbgC/FadM family acyl-CoA thioesterase [Acetobacteraceae bacterium]|jgi:acyl-CoA thioester hydrolase
MNGNPPSIPADGKHRYAVRVYYEDTDAGGVVYHATYMRFAERARTEALRDVGIPHAELLRQFASMFVVRRIEVDYLRPARVDDSLIVVTELLSVGGATVTLRQDVRGPEGSCAVLMVRLACVRPGNGKPGRVPQRWRMVLTDMCAAAKAALDRE